MAEDEAYWPIPEKFAVLGVYERYRATCKEVATVRDWMWKTPYALALVNAHCNNYGRTGDVAAEIHRQPQFSAIPVFHLVGVVWALVEDMMGNQSRLPSDLRERFPELYAFERHEAAQEPDDVVPLPGDPPRPK